MQNIKLPVSGLIVVISVLFSIGQTLFLQYMYFFLSQLIISLARECCGCQATYTVPVRSVDSATSDSAYEVSDSVSFSFKSSSTINQTTNTYGYLCMCTSTYQIQHNHHLLSVPAHSWYVQRCLNIAWFVMVCVFIVCRYLCLVALASWHSHEIAIDRTRRMLALQNKYTLQSIHLSLKEYQF